MATADEPRARWLVSSNPDTFDAEGAFREHDEVMWSQTGDSMQVGDLVYLRSTGSPPAITHVLRVVETGLPSLADDPTADYWHNPVERARREGTRRWMRLRLVHTLTSDERARLSLARLREAKGEGGETDNFQGRRRLTAGVLDLVLAVLSTPRVPEDNDQAAQEAPADPDETEALTRQVEQGDYRVPDTYATAKTRGSAQRVFAAVVKGRYGGCCAVTGIRTPDFLVASHIVPWSVDETIRLDPTNGICLSTLIDRAFDTGYLHITPDATVELDHARLADDPALAAALARYEGRPLTPPTGPPPSPGHLQRRYDLDVAKDAQQETFGSRDGGAPQ